MAPRLPVATRLAPLCCALALAIAPALSACGGDGAATAENAPAAAPEQRPAPGSRAETGSTEPCPAKVGALVDSLDRLRRQLAIGLSYEQYATKIKALRGSYDKVPVGHLTLDCLSTAATPAERALNKYIDATNAWGECLADATCTTATIEPVLQRKWRVASRFLSEAQ